MVCCVSVERFSDKSGKCRFCCFLVGGKAGNAWGGFNFI
jgi:hypothetical protein